MDFGKILSNVATKGDVATVLLCGTAGFAVDLLAFPFGVPPGTVATLSAAGGLGVKNAIQAAIEARQAGRDAERDQRERMDAKLLADQSDRKVRDRADRFSNFLDENGVETERDALRAEIILFDDDMITADDLRAAIEFGKGALRARIREQGLRLTRHDPKAVERGTPRPAAKRGKAARALNVDDNSGDSDDNWLVS